MINIKTLGKRKKGTDGSSSSFWGVGFANGNITVQNDEVKGVNIWGQYHDHSGDVDGDLTANGNITSSGNITASGDVTATNADFSGTLNADDGIFNGDISCVDVNCSVINASDISTEFLTVTKAAHFFNLTIDEIKSVGGQIILSAANATIDYVEQLSGQYVLAWKYDDGDKGIGNQFKVNDQIICQTFNQTATNGVNVENKYYWALVTMVGNGTYTIDGESVDCHYIVLSNAQDGFDGQSIPEAGDKICQLGYRGNDDNARQSAIILSAYQSVDTNVTAPSIVQYTGIDSFTLNGCIVNQMSPTENLFTGEFRVINNGTTTDVIDLINGQNPQVITDSEQSWIMADSSGKTYYLSDYQNLPTTIKAYLGSDLIPYSEWTTGSQIKFKNKTYRLTGAATAVTQYTGLGIDSITRNTNDVTLAWGYMANTYIDSNTGTTTNSGTLESNRTLEITIVFTHNGTTYTVAKNVPFNMIKASAVTQGADAEFDKLMVDKLDLTVTMNNELTANVDAKVFHIKGSNITQVTDLTDYTANILLSNNQTVSLNKSTSFTKSGTISNDYTGMTNPPTSATLRLYKSNALLDEVTTAVKFAAGSIFTITNNAISSAVQQANTYTDGEITTVNATISNVQQTANSISTRVTNIENDYVTSSELTQTANNIQLNVYDELKNKTGIDISNGQITLNGNTLVNGNLTLTDNEQGFTLVGNGGITQIMPKSIGTYNDFTTLTTTTIVKEAQTNGVFSTSTSTYRRYVFTAELPIGVIKSGETIRVQPQPNEYGKTQYKIIMPQGIVNIVGQGNLTEISKQIAFIEDGTVKQTYNYTSGQLSYVVQGGYVTVRTTYTVDIYNGYFENGGENPYQVIKVDVVLPNDVFMLIGNDGLAVNFGSTKNVYIGAESTTLRYGQYGFKVDATDGVQIFNGVYWYTLDEYIGMIAGHQ